MYLNRQVREANSRGGSSQFKGVYWMKGLSLWRAQVSMNKRLVDLGTFADETEAALAYDAGAQIAHGERARLNFPAETIKAKLSPRMLAKLEGRKLD